MFFLLGPGIASLILGFAIDSVGLSINPTSLEFLNLYGAAILIIQMMVIAVYYISDYLLNEVRTCQSIGRALSQLQAHTINLFFPFPRTHCAIRVFTPSSGSFSALGSSTTHSTSWTPLYTQPIIYYNLRSRLAPDSRRVRGLP